MKQSDFIPNKAIWTTPYIRPDKGFEFEVELHFDDRIIRQTIDNLQLGTYQPIRNQSSAYEWGYSFTHLDGQVDGSGRKIEAGYHVPPADRKEALSVIKQFLLSAYLNNGEGPRPWISMNGHYPWHHYAGEFGFDILASEIGENINSYQWHIAINRGAARQYGKPWVIDFSAWHWDGITGYIASRWGDTSGPDKGHSMSLLRRAYFMSYMAGANRIIAEAGASISFYDKVDGDGNYLLSPFGEAGRDCYHFALANPDAGIAYTPFGIVLDYYHGVYPGFEDKKAFNHFPYNDGDNMTWELINMFFPGGWEVIGKQEKGTLVNGPYGDTCDILLQNAPQEVLNSYPVLILSGDIKLSEEEAARYKAYAKQGGTLVLNSAYLSYFPEYKQDFGDKPRYDITKGDGRIIVYGSGYSVSNLNSIIREQLDALMPFKVSADIQHMVNVMDGSLFITLINSDGVTKDIKTKPVIDSSKVKTVSVTYTGKETIQWVKDILNNARISTNPDNVVGVTIEPGEMMILEYRFD